MLPQPSPVTLKEKNISATICFVHYGIGWKDGINTVLKTLTKEISKKYPSIKIEFLGGQIKERFLKNASYKTIPELLPNKKKLTKQQIYQKTVIIAEKLASLTEGKEIVIIENPFLGDYHLPAMIGYSLYAKKYRPKGTKIFFRIHDLYNNSYKYTNFQKILSFLEIRDIVKGEGVDSFFVLKRAMKKELIKIGVPSKKISYLPNGIDTSVFKQRLEEFDKSKLYKILKIPASQKKTAKILLYPVRVVPRKNIEEAILLVQFIRELTKENYFLVVSGQIDVNDPQATDYYKHLIRLKQLADFPIILSKGAFTLERRYDQQGAIKEFGIGDLYQICEAVIMTSIEEGFGYPFLESWFAKKIVIGRRIPDVISDFERTGVKFWWLYSHFLINKKRQDLAQIRNNNKGFNRIKKVAEILQNKKAQKEVLKLNATLLETQIEMLQNKKRQAQIIKNNFQAAKKTYDISKITNQFLKLTGLK